MLINLAGGLHGGGSLLGVLFIVIAVLTAAMYSILSRRASRIFQPAEVTWVMLWMSAIVFTGICWGRMLVTGAPWQAYFAPFQDMRGYVGDPVLEPALLGGGVPALKFPVLSRLEAARSAAMANITTMISVFAGVLILNEPFGWFHAVGSAMILAGVWGVNRFHRRPLSPEEAAPIPDVPLS